MGTVQASDLELLSAEWPGWRLWPSQRGELACASRRRTLTGREAHAGLAPTLVEDTVADLVHRLGEQAEIERTLGPAAAV
ncbi:MAG: hypothetical protein JWO67_3284 [Streptosporangiaceae bacterium]|jgi:hypothetical protein|nr:hypothetical protein [Streptosporangiaceae bacterium]